MKRTSWQARRDRRLQFWMGYAAWLVQRLQEDGIVGRFTRRLVETEGHARVMYRAEVRYAKRRWLKRRVTGGY